MQVQPDFTESIFHLFVVTTGDKDTFVKHLAENNIIAAFHYPVPCHLQKAYAHLNHKPGDCPHSEYLADHCVSLPMFAELSDDDVLHVINTINSF
jgi:dTDP-4-amino-4,6-dideoxygalactose transaminase